MSRDPQKLRLSELLPERGLLVSFWKVQLIGNLPWSNTDVPGRSNGLK